MPRAPLRVERNIITLEDPVEYELPMIRQSQINVRAGLTFSTGLRSILRQDPDIIFVGEIRDAETLEMSVRAALTGHLVFSTLHTNDSAGAVPRMVDLGVEPFLLSSSLIAVLAQRLVRRICSGCKALAQPDPELLKKAGLAERAGNLTFYEGKGCQACRNTGFRGRLGIFEVFAVTPAIARVIQERGDSATLRRLAQREGMRTMFEDGLRKVLAGLTTLEEVAREALSS
ncbi:MAG: Flp pilus assembly complex ATPase component TadA [Deltaproteobacteria bacterium]|nr:Flp pilus assembly complex ATPase component TadA [Deltaproteobacteria bacterium]